MINQHVKGRVGIPEILNNQRLPLGFGALHVVALFRIGMILGAPGAHFARRQFHVR